MGIKGAGFEKSSKASSEIPSSSMADIAFLLLIFFMVTSVISTSANPDLPKSAAGDTQEVDKQVVLVLENLM